MNADISAEWASKADPAKLTGWKQFLLAEGWGQNGYVAPRGYCLIGALAYGVYSKISLAEQSAEYFLVESILIERGWKEPVHAWNDETGRTMDEVVGLIDEAYSRVKRHLNIA